MTELIKAFMTRDEVTEQEATEIVEDMRQRVIDGENPEEILYDEGFEPDYIFDIIG